MPLIRETSGVIIVYNRDTEKYFPGCSVNEALAFKLEKRYPQENPNAVTWHLFCVEGCAAGINYKHFNLGVTIHNCIRARDFYLRQAKEFWLTDAKPFTDAHRRSFEKCRQDLRDQAEQYDHVIEACKRFGDQTIKCQMVKPGDDLPNIEFVLKSTGKSTVERAREDTTEVWVCRQGGETGVFVSEGTSDVFIPEKEYQDKQDAALRAKADQRAKEPVRVRPLLPPPPKASSNYGQASS